MIPNGIQGVCHKYAILGSLGACALAYAGIRGSLTYRLEPCLLQAASGTCLQAPNCKPAKQRLPLRDLRTSFLRKLRAFVKPAAVQRTLRQQQQLVISLLQVFFSACPNKIGRMLTQVEELSISKGVSYRGPATYPGVPLCVRVRARHKHPKR